MHFNNVNVPEATIKRYAYVWFIKNTILSLYSHMHTSSTQQILVSKHILVRPTTKRHMMGSRNQIYDDIWHTDLWYSWKTTPYLTFWTRCFDEPIRSAQPKQQHHYPHIFHSQQTLKFSVLIFSKLFWNEPNQLVSHKYFLRAKKPNHDGHNRNKF